MRKMRIGKISTALVLPAMLAISFILLSLAEAQAEPQELEAEVSVRPMLDADIEDFGTEVGLTKVGFSATYLCFTFNYTLNSYSWDDINDNLPFGNGTDDPWDTLHELEFGLRYIKPFDDGWSYFALASALLAYEDEINEAFGYEITAGLIYEPAPEWEFRLGTQVAYNEVSECKVYPIGAILWNQEAEEGFSAILGLPESCLKYHFTPDVSSKIEFSFDKDLYRLADDSTVAQEGYLEYEGLVLGVHLDINISENALFTIGTEYNFERGLALYGQDGQDMSSHDIDSAFGGVFKLAYTF